MQRVLGQSSPLPWNEDQHDNASALLSNSDCYEAHVVLYEKNPFVYSDHAAKVRNGVQKCSKSG